MAMQEHPTLGAIAAQEDKAPLACGRCKRRKIKCDRIRPGCRSCSKTSHTCSYPTSSQKPGPKPGVSQRRKAENKTGPPLSAARFESDSPVVGNGETSTSNVDQRESLAASPQSSRTQSQFNDGVGVQQSLGPGNSASRLPALSLLLQLSHDPVPNGEPQTAPDTALGGWRGIGGLCADLEISPNIYPFLLNAYFDNMTAFSIFHRPTFATKVSLISSPTEQRALIASMFAFSARFQDPNQVQAGARPKIPPPGHFRKIAEDSVEQALNECLDESPSLCLLQSLILTTFQQLTNGVRGRAWRALHTCVSIAYDLHLHLVDKPSSKQSLDDDENILLEEQRRVWWTLWEFDVFASTVRKLPTAMDWNNNETCLPIDDDLWFNSISARSCTLNPDPALAWKDLERSGNQSSKAWFIVINALMRCCQIVAFPYVYSNNELPHGSLSSLTHLMRAIQPRLDVLANSLYCLSASLPDALSYRGEFLNFSPGRSLHKDSAKHCIHIMMQLSRFMLQHLRVFNSTSKQLGVENSSSSSEHAEEVAEIDPITSMDKAAWNIYLAAASEIVAIVRNSSPKHVRHVNPFLSSTIWLAAAAQITSRKIGPHIVNQRVAESNFDVLQMNLDAYVAFWGVSSSLQQKLKALNARMESVNIQASNSASRAPETQRQQLPIVSSYGVSQTPQSINTDGGFHNVTAMQYFPSDRDARQRADLPIWSAPQTLNFEDGVISGLSPNNLWGSYNLDELLVYGGFE